MTVDKNKIDAGQVVAICQNIMVEFGKSPEEIEKVLIKILDSSKKEDGAVANYNKALSNEDGTVTPHNGTKYLLSLCGVSEEEWDNKVKGL